MRIKSFIFSLFLVLGTVVPGFAGIPERPDPPRLVNDFAGIFTPAQVAELESMLVSFDDSTSNQITVVTVNDLEGYAPAEYAVKIGLSW
ncbi:MAG: TPM domain-containing protein, partial [Bacteroidales bacterium]|nr:TPM domain-containing protein [Bacteroidales bacterium]